MAVVDGEARPFRIVVTIPVNADGNYEICLPLCYSTKNPWSSYYFTNQQYMYNFDIDWGDSTSTNNIMSYTDTNRFHTYAAPGTYIIKINGLFEGWDISKANKDQCQPGIINTNLMSNIVTKVIEYGDVEWKSLCLFLHECYNLTDIPCATLPVPTNDKSTLRYTLMYCGLNALTGVVKTSTTDTISTSDIYTANFDLIAKETLEDPTILNISLDGFLRYYNNATKIPKCITNILNSLFSLTCNGDGQITLLANNKTIDLESNGSIFDPASEFTESISKKLSYFNKFDQIFYTFNIDNLMEHLKKPAITQGISSIVCKRIPVYHPLSTIFSNDFSYSSIISCYTDSEPYLYQRYDIDDLTFYDFYLKPIDTKYGVNNWSSLRWMFPYNNAFTTYFDNHLKCIVSSVNSDITKNNPLFNYENYLHEKTIQYYDPDINGTVSTYYVPDGFKYVDTIPFDDIPGESAVILEYVNKNNTRVRCKYQYYSSVPYEYACMSSSILDPTDPTKILHINHFDKKTEDRFESGSDLAEYEWKWKRIFEANYERRLYNTLYTGLEHCIFFQT